MSVKKVERKVSKIGNSLGVTFPPKVLAHIGASQGDSIVFSFEKDGAISVKKTKKLNFDGIEGVDQEFLNGLEHLFSDYDNALNNLANR